MRRGPMRWGTIEMGDQWVRGTNEIGDQWNGWCMGAIWGTNEMGDWWVMSWGTNVMGNQWDGGSLGLADEGWLMKRGTNEMGTNEMGDQWDGGPMSSNNVLGDQWVGGPMRRGPMRWGTNERVDQWADPVHTSKSMQIWIIYWWNMLAYFYFVSYIVTDCDIFISPSLNIAV